MSSMSRWTMAAVALWCGTALAGPKPGNPARPSGSEPVYHHQKFFTGNVFMGYNGGASLFVSGTFANLAQGLPVALRLGIGHSWVAPGDAMRARRVFIDQNTNGEPRGEAKTWDYRFDVMYPIKFFSLQRTSVFGGVRRSEFDAYFEYIGGNETFDVIGKQWGVGGGLETAFAISPVMDLLVSGGADYYFSDELNGHDTYYQPDGDDLNAKENFTWKDADAAINQPDVEIRFMVGLGYRF